MKDIDFDRLGVRVVQSVSEISSNILQMGIPGEPSEEKMVNRFIEKSGADFNVFPSGPDVIDITANNKGEALLEIANQFDIPLVNTYAFGDSHNDISMLKIVGHTYLMENADDSLKKIIPNHCAHVAGILKKLLTRNMLATPGVRYTLPDKVFTESSRQKALTIAPSSDNIPTAPDAFGWSG